MAWQLAGLLCVCVQYEYACVWVCTYLCTHIQRPEDDIMVSGLPLYSILYVSPLRQDLALNPELDWWPESLSLPLIVLGLQAPWDKLPAF